ncbi:MAG: hypothetical protein KDA58_02835 [Planctomycetaceae bacterium]|nr:hypothetical protein [Planctomycetaceae bacterium]
MYRGVLAFALGLIPFSAWGQGPIGPQVVQQPVVQQFGVDTAVSVPDRGSAFLGGVSSAQDARTQFGWGLHGSAIGTARSHSGTDVRVWIHDFEAMDRALLAQPASTTSLGTLSPSHRALVEAHRRLGSEARESNLPQVRITSADRTADRVQLPTGKQVSLPHTGLSPAEVLARHRGSRQPDAQQLLGTPRLSGSGR